MGVAIRFALFAIVADPVRLTTLTAAYRQNDHPSNDSLSEKLFLTILQPPREFKGRKDQSRKRFSCLI